MGPGGFDLDPKCKRSEVFRVALCKRPLWLPCGKWRGAVTGVGRPVRSVSFPVGTDRGVLNKDDWGLLREMFLPGLERSLGISDF